MALDGFYVYCKEGEDTQDISIIEMAEAMESAGSKEETYTGYDNSGQEGIAKKNILTFIIIA